MVGERLEILKRCVLGLQICLAILLQPASQKCKTVFFKVKEISHVVFQIFVALLSVSGSFFW